MIIIRQNILKDPKSIITGLGSKFAIISDENVSPIYGQALLKDLSKLDVEAFLFSFPSGEIYKTRATKERLEDQMLEAGLGPDTCVIALGGGVVTDMAGFLAATYCRGIPLVLIPTSLLAMVDASIGGKNGVDHPLGKNLIGSLYEPDKILIDAGFLKSLPLHELRNGFVEMIKHGIVGDQRYFESLEKYPSGLLSADSPLLERMIAQSCRIKSQIVQQGTGKRHLLNFGHTVGHALENLTQYELSHGEAVAIGMLVESQMAVNLGHLKPSSLDRIKAVLAKYTLPLKLPSEISIDALLNIMILDKKSINSRPRFVLINEIGSPLNCRHVEEPVIKNALQWMNDALCSH